MTKAEYTAIRSQLDFNRPLLPLIIHLICDGFLLGSTVFAPLVFGKSGYLVTIPALSAFYFRSFSVMHDAVHGSLCRSRKWNDFLGLAYGIFCFLPFEHWKEIHLLHHQWSGNVEKDPVMKLVLDFRKPPTRFRNFLSVLWKSWFPILAILQNYVFWYVCTTRFISGEKNLSRFLSLAMPVLCWSMVMWQCGPVLGALVIVPSILCYLELVEIINFPHHMDLPQYGGETKLALWEQHEIARSCFYPKILSHYIFLNFNYHVEHHLFPTLPWHQLARLSHQLKATVSGYNSSIGNAWIRSNRKISLEAVLTRPRATQATPKESDSKAA